MAQFWLANVSFACSGTIAFLHSSMSSQPWIIDFKAYDHLTGMPHSFSSYRVASGQDKVRIVDGSLSYLLCS